MPTERRDQQNLSLITGTQIAHSGNMPEHMRKYAEQGIFLNRWVRIGLKAQDRKEIGRASCRERV